MTENKKLTFTDCKTELIRLDGQSVVTSSITGGKDDWSNEPDNQLIGDEKKLG